MSKKQDMAAIEKLVKSAHPTRSGLNGVNLNPYTGIEYAKIVEFEVGKQKRSFLVMTYQAYNAMGLIGSECNGIAILDNDAWRVLADELCMEGTGYFGVSARQAKEWERVCNMSWEEFQAYVNNSRRNRYEI